MKTLALQKIIEKRNFLLGRIAHRIKQTQKGEIDVKDFARYYRDYKSEFKGYIDSMRDMEIITNEDRQKIYDSFIEKIDNI